MQKVRSLLVKTNPFQEADESVFVLLKEIKKLIKNKTKTGNGKLPTRELEALEKSEQYEWVHEALRALKTAVSVEKVIEGMPVSAQFALEMMQ